MRYAEKSASARAKSAKTTTNVAPAAKAAPKAETNTDAKIQMVDMVAEKTALTKQNEEAVSAAMDTIVNAIRAGQRVGPPGLGPRSVKVTAARTGVRPGTRRSRFPLARRAPAH